MSKSGGQKKKVLNLITELAYQMTSIMQDPTCIHPEDFRERFVLAIEAAKYGAYKLGATTVEVAKAYSKGVEKGYREWEEIYSKLCVKKK